MPRTLRASLYAFHPELQRQKQLRDMAKVGGFEKLPDAWEKQNASNDELILKKIGLTWYKILKNHTSYSGLCVEKLCKVLVYDSWYEVFYRPHCQSVHAADGMKHLAIDGDSLKTIFVYSDDDVGEALEWGIKMLWRCIVIMDTNVTFGLKDSGTGMAIAKKKVAFLRDS